MDHSDRMNLLSHCPPEWKRIATTLISMRRRNSLSEVRYESDHFGNACMTLRLPGLRVKFTKDRSDEWITVKAAWGLRWVEINDAIELIEKVNTEPWAMPDSLAFVEDELIHWSTAKCFKFASLIWINFNRIDTLTRKKREPAMRKLLGDRYDDVF